MSVSHKIRINIGLGGIYWNNSNKSAVCIVKIKGIHAIVHTVFNNKILLKLPLQLIPHYE
jgi:hypothetical protein